MVRQYFECEKCGQRAKYECDIVHIYESHKDDEPGDNSQIMRYKIGERQFVAYYPPIDETAGIKQRFPADYLTRHGRRVDKANDSKGYELSADVRDSYWMHESPALDYAKPINDYMNTPKIQEAYKSFANWLEKRTAESWFDEFIRFDDSYEQSLDAMYHDAMPFLRIGGDGGMVMFPGYHIRWYDWVEY